MAYLSYEFLTKTTWQLVLKGDVDWISAYICGILHSILVEHLLRNEEDEWWIYEDEEENWKLFLP